MSTIFRYEDLILLLVGYYLDVVRSRGKSESHGIPVPHLDGLEIDLDTGISAGSIEILRKAHILQSPGSS